MHARVADHYPRTTFHTVSNPTVTLVRNGPLNTACRTLIEESSGCEDDQAALQGAENRSCLAQVMRSGTVGVGSVPKLGMVMPFHSSVKRDDLVFYEFLRQFYKMPVKILPIQHILPI